MQAFAPRKQTPPGPTNVAHNCGIRSRSGRRLIRPAVETAVRPRGGRGSRCRQCGRCGGAIVAQGCAVNCISNTILIYFSLHLESRNANSTTCDCVNRNKPFWTGIIDTVVSVVPSQLICEQLVLQKLPSIYISALWLLGLPEVMHRYVTNSTCHSNYGNVRVCARTCVLNVSAYEGNTHIIPVKCRP